MLYKKYNSHLFWTLKYLWLLFFLHIALAYGCGVVGVQSVSHFQLFATPRIIACQASLSLTISWSLFKLMSIESVMSSNHLILSPIMETHVKIYNVIAVLQLDTIENKIPTAKTQVLVKFLNGICIKIISVNLSRIYW